MRYFFLFPFLLKLYSPPPCFFFLSFPTGYGCSRARRIFFVFLFPFFFFRFLFLSASSITLFSLFSLLPPFFFPPADKSFSSFPDSKMQTWLQNISFFFLPSPFKDMRIGKNLLSSFFFFSFEESFFSSFLLTGYEEEDALAYLLPFE